MANTTSISFPNMINVSQNKVSVYEDTKSVVNRNRLLFLTEPTELYNEPDFGVGLHKRMWQYNNENQKAIILDKMKDQLRKHEPYCIPENTQYADGLMFTGGKEDTDATKADELEMTVSICTTFSSRSSIKIGVDNVSI